MAHKGSLLTDPQFLKGVAVHYNDTEISDVILLVRNKKFFAHKFVLAKSSDVLRTMLYKRKWEEAGKPEIKLEESDECAKVFDLFLKFLYTGEVNLSADSASAVLTLADKYNVTSLVGLCISHMSELCLDYNHIHHTVQWYPIAKSMNADQLQKACTKTIRLSFGALLNGKKLNYFDIGSLSDFLRSSDLLVKDEYSLWEGVSEWLMVEERRESLSSNALLLLPLIRFSQMLLHQLNQVEKSDLANTPECGDLIIRLLFRAYKFRSILPLQASIGVTFDDDIYRPRLYQAHYAGTLNLDVNDNDQENKLYQLSVTTMSSALPTDDRNAHWMVSISRGSGVWQMKLYCQESSMIDQRLTYQIAVIYCSSPDSRKPRNIVPSHVQREPSTACSNGGQQFLLNLPTNIRKMHFIVEILPHGCSEDGDSFCCSSDEAETANI